jgi:hypothetical protein
MKPLERLASLTENHSLADVEQTPRGIVVDQIQNLDGQGFSTLVAIASVVRITTSIKDPLT